MKGNVSLAQASAEEVVLPERVQEALGELVGSAKEGLLALSVCNRGQVPDVARTRGRPYAVQQLGPDPCCTCCNKRDLTPVARPPPRDDQPPHPPA